MPLFLARLLQCTAQHIQSQSRVIMHSSSESERARASTAASTAAALARSQSPPSQPPAAPDRPPPLGSFLLVLPVLFLLLHPSFVERGRGRGSSTRAAYTYCAAPLLLPWDKLHVLPLQ